MINVSFTKRRMEYFAEALEKGMPIQPSPDGWTADDVLALAGVCRHAATIKKIRELENERSFQHAPPEKKKMKTEGLFEMIPHAIEFYFGVAALVAQRKYDDAYDPEAKATLYAHGEEKRSNFAIASHKGFKGLSRRGSKTELTERTKSLFKRATRLELLSLEPSQRVGLREMSEAVTTSSDSFRGYPVLGRLNVEDPATQQRLLRAVERGVTESDGVVAGCFNPRHGLRMVCEPHVLDFVICFECFSILGFEDRELVENLAVTESPQTILDELLTANDIPLAPKP